MTEKKNNNLPNSEDEIVLERKNDLVSLESVDDVADSDELSFTSSAKPDEYIENLMDAELAQAEAEAEAELKKEAKRKKDKAKAREKDKRAQEEANKKHEQDLAREKERLAESDRTRFVGDNRMLANENPQSIDDNQYDRKPSEDARFEKTSKETSFSIPAFDDPSNNVPTNNGEFSDVSQQSHRVEASSDAVHLTTPTNDIVPSGDIQDNTSNDIQGSYNGEHTQNPSTSAFPNEYLERKHKEKRDALYEEQLERQKLEKEQNEAFLEKIHQNAYEKQRASEQYQSFGNEGIDYSGENRHNSYVYSEDVIAKESVITEPIYQAIRDNYEKSKAEFKSYGGHVPEAVMEQYRHNSELYFSTERRIHEGSLFVKPEKEVPLPTRKTEQFDFAEEHHYVRDDNKVTQPVTASTYTREELRYNDTSSPSVTTTPQEPQKSHYTENNSPASKPFVFSSSHQDMARRAQEVLAQTKNNETYEQPKGSSHHFSTNERASDNTDSRVYHISQERYNSLKTKYKASMAEIDSYEGKDIPPSVLRRNEQINKLYTSVENKISQGTVSVVPNTSYPRDSRQPKNDFGTKDNVNRTGRSSSEGTNPAFSSTVYNITKERYESLKKKHLDSVKEMASYEGRNIPPSVLRRNEQINKVYSAIKEKVDSGKVNIVSEGGVGLSTHSGRHVNNGNNIKQASNRNPNVILGSQIISEINKHNYSAKSDRTGDGHRKPPKTPFQASPLSKYDKLKIYHSRNYLAPFERGTRRAVGALSSTFVYAARSEQTGTVNTMVSAEQRTRDTVNTIKVLKNTPRNVAAAYYVTKNAAITARNVTRFVEGKEALAHKSHKPLTVKQLDKQFKNPFAGAEKIKIDKKFGANANLVDSQINRKLIIKTAQNKALKNQIKELQAKGSALTAEERKSLKALLDKKKAADVDPRKLHGLKKARTEAIKRNREVDRLSEKASKKTIKKTSKNGLKLSKKDKLIMARLRDREAFLNKRQKLLKAKDARKQLTTSLSTLLTRAASESEDSAVQSILNADRVLQNRYVRSILRFSTKATLLPVVAAKKVTVGTYNVGLLLDNKFNHGRIGAKIDTGAEAVKSVNRAVKKVGKDAVGSVVNSRFYKEINGGAYNRAKKQIVKHTPEKIKTRVKKVNNTVGKLNTKRKAVLDKFNNLKKRLAGSRVGRAVSSVSKGIGNVFSAFSFVKKTLYKIGLICASFLIIVAMVGAAISSAGTAVSSLILSDSNVTDEGKIDLSAYYAIILEEWNDYIQDLNAQGSAEGAEKVVVNMDPVPSNGREILSMMAVRMSQDLDLDNNGDIEPYLRYLVRQLNPFYSVVSYYSCSGCKTEIYYCSAEDCSGHERIYCPGDHKMITFNVTPSYFGPQEDLNDPMFSADEMGNAGQSSIAGGLLGRFKITYYCTEKYEHICNAGPPYQTATGTEVTPGRTIAVDPSVIPLGSHVIIDGHEYIAEDTGGAINGNRIDIAVNTHDEAMSKGTRNNVAVYAVGYEGEDIDTAGEWQGWNEGNIEWAKNLFYQDWSELYSGLPAGTAGGGGSTDLSGVHFVNGVRPGNNKIVDIAKAEEGVSGRPNKYTYWYGKIGNTYSYHWCAAFVSWCANQAGYNSAVGKFAYCPSWADSFSSKGQWARPGDITPVAGDIIFFDWEVDGITDHVGIVIGSDGSKVYTVEGNSSDRVKIKSYNLNYRSIYGYGLPNY